MKSLRKEKAPAAGGVDCWTVFIMADARDHRLNYDLPVYTTIERILDKWINDLDMYGHWVMTSIDGITQYDNDLTIEMIGETVPGAKIITLKAKKIGKARKSYAEVLLLDGDNSDEKLVSIDQTLGSSVNSHGIFECGGTLASLNSSFRDIDEHEKMVIYKTCAIHVRLSNSSSVVIRVVDSGTVQDLKNRLMEFESGCFCLKFMGRVIHPQEPIKALLYSKKRYVEVYRPTITVRLADRSVRWSTNVEDLRYGELLCQLFRNGAMKSKVLENISFRCVGCERRLWSDEECFQKVMSDCCQVQSLDLEEVQNFEDKSIQTGDPLSWSVTVQQYGILDDMVNEVFGDRRRGRRRLQNKCVQYDWENDSTENVPIMIHGYTGLEILYAKLNVPIPLTTNYLRNIIYQRWRWNPSNVLLFRRNGFGRSDGSKCVHICGESDDWRWGRNAEYFNAAGFTLSHTEVEREWSWNCETLLENAAVPIWGKFRNIISAEYREKPLVPISIYIVNKIRCGKDFMVDLRIETEVFKTRHLKFAIAEQLKIDSSNLKLQWRGGNVDGKLCLHVCDEEGKFVDGDRENAVFVNEKKETFTRNEIDIVKLEKLENQYNYWENPVKIILEMGEKYKWVLVVTVDHGSEVGSMTI